MKTRTFSVVIALLLALSSVNSNAQDNSFSGEWKINLQKTQLGEAQLYLSGIRILLKGDSLKTTRTYTDVNGSEYPFDEPLTLDGKEYKIYIYDMPRKAKASRSASDGSIAIETTTTFNGNSGPEDLVSKESWKVESDGQTLTMTFTTKMSGGEFPGVYYYSKVK